MRQHERVIKGSKMYIKGKMRRFTASLLCLCLSLGGCGSAGQASFSTEDSPELASAVSTGISGDEADSNAEPKAEKPTDPADVSAERVNDVKRTTEAPESTQTGTGTATSGTNGTRGSTKTSASGNNGGGSGGNSSGYTSPDSGSSGYSGYSGGSGSTGGSGGYTGGGQGEAVITARTTAASGKGGSTRTTAVSGTEQASVTTAAPVTTEPVLPENPTPQELLDSMTLRQKVYQMFICDLETIACTGTVTSVTGEVRNTMENYPVGGVILFAKNLQSRDQTMQLLADLQECSYTGLFTAVDEEGGTVARCAQKLGTAAFENMAVYGEENNSETARYIGETIGNDLNALGFNLDFAPVADVNIDPGNELGSRIFSSDPGVVANMAANVAMGLQSSGVCATLKHFPGLGAENGNTHTDSFVVIDRTIDELRENEFVPFSVGINAGVDFIMVGHQITTGFGDDLPADLSYTAVTEYLRGELGFGGIVVTDSHQMNTIASVYGAADSAVMAVEAGVDIILMPYNLTEAADAVIQAVESGEIPESRIDESVFRILDQKYRLGLF